MSKNILVVDDEADIRNLIKGILEDEKYQVRQAASAKQAYEEINTLLPDLVVLDIWLQGSDHDGLQILTNIKRRHPNLPVIMISGHGSIETAVNSIKQGAYDFIEKPFKSDRLLLMTRRALETAQLRLENEALKKKTTKPAKLVGTSPVTQTLRQLLEKVAPTNSRILLTGEPGSGKDVAARLIHDTSARADKPFVVINCATLRPDKMEIEIFGSDEPGNESTGVLEEANRGTLFLDEISDMPLEGQAKIMRVLQEQKFVRTGGQKEIIVDIRIIASTNRDLEKLIAEGKFRQDLYYRLNVVPIKIAPLRERSHDIPELLKYFTSAISEQSGLPNLDFTAKAITVLQSYHWPGNIRQLRNAVEWAMIMTNAKTQNSIDAEDLPPELSKQILSAGDTKGQNSNYMALPLREAREIFEREYLQSQVYRFGGNISKTAQFIGMERSALHRKLKSLNIAGTDKDEDSQNNVTSIVQKRA